MNALITAMNHIVWVRVCESELWMFALSWFAFRFALVWLVLVWLVLVWLTSSPPPHRHCRPPCPRNWDVCSLPSLPACMQRAAPCSQRQAYTCCDYNCRGRAHSEHNCGENVCVGERQPATQQLAVLYLFTIFLFAPARRHSHHHHCLDASVPLSHISPFKATTYTADYVCRIGACLNNMKKKNENKNCGNEKGATCLRNTKLVGISSDKSPVD